MGSHARAAAYPIKREVHGSMRKCCSEPQEGDSQSNEGYTSGKPQAIFSATRGPTYTDSRVFLIGPGPIPGFCNSILSEPLNKRQEVVANSHMRDKGELSIKARCEPSQVTTTTPERSTPSRLPMCHHESHCPHPPKAGKSREVLYLRMPPRAATAEP